MPVFSNILAGAAGSGGAGDYTIQKSLRFNDGDSAHLSRTPSSAGNRKTWTFSTWCKIATPGAAGILLNAQNGTTQGFANNFWILFYGGTLVVGDGSTDFLNTNKLRDPSAWYHIVVACDTTQSAASDRLKIYINGVESEYTGDARSSISQNSDTAINSTYLHKIGDSGSYHAYFDGYLAETHLVDGQALSPTDFGAFDVSTGVWNPKKFSGARGTNGFHLDYSDNSSNAALGYDAAGSNNWSVNNITGVTTTTNWASQLSVNNSSNSILNPANLFDGSITTYARLNLEQNGYRGIVWTPATTTTVSSSLRVRWNSWTSTQYNNGYVYVNGQNQGQVPSGQNGWYTVSFTGTITTLELRSQYNSGGGHHIDWAAIEVDGSIIKDPGPEEVDVFIDSPSSYDADAGNNGGNYAVFNPLHVGGSMTLSQGNLQVNNTSANAWRIQHATIGGKTGKYYAEFTFTGTGIAECSLGVGPSTEGLDYFAGSITGSFNWFLNNGFYTAGGYLDQSGNWASGSGFSDVYGIAVDLDNSTVSWYRSGTLIGTKSMVNRIEENYHIYVSIYGGHAAIANFGQRAFQYPPGGTGGPAATFKSLCTQNLPAPTINKGTEYFETKLFTGNGGTQSITGFDMSPDLVWIKQRNTTRNHLVFDTVRGSGKFLVPNSSGNQGTNSGMVTSFDSNGFSLGSTADVNENNGTFCAWGWDAGSSTVSNTDGNFTTNVRANQSAGFSIVEAPSITIGSKTLGHGLAKTPDLIYVKRVTNGTEDWYVWHRSLGLGKQLRLNGTAAEASTSSFSTVNSSVFSYDPNTGDHIAYCWTSVENYSFFGSFTGNGSADGPFISLPFRPAYVWTKVATGSSVQGWLIRDNKRDPDNVVETFLASNNNNADVTNATNYGIDFLANGFKIRGTDGGVNQNGGKIVFAAFAESPLKYARAR